MTNKRKILHYMLLIAACFVTGLFYTVNSPRRFVAGELLLMLAVCAVAFCLYKKGISGCWLFAVFGLMFLLRAGYIINTPTWIRQHDVIGFGNEFGQAAFIEYFYNHFQLIDFDPRDYWGFFQPPLHHMLAALFLRLNVFMGFAYNHACENVQVLTLFYSCVMTIFSLKLLREFEIKGLPLVVAFGIASLHPSFVLMAGSINNDMLMILLQVMSAYYLVRWYKKPSGGTIFVLALCVGGSMMAKASGFLIAPAIGVVFLYQWLTNRNQWKFYWKQFLVFAVVSIPIGIWSPVRNLVKFGVPLTFTPEVGEPVAMFGILRRIFDVRIATPYTCMIVNGDSYDEFNVPLALLKTSLFGEYNYGQIPAITPFAWVLLISGAILAIAAFACMLYYLFSQKSILPIQARLFFGIYYVTSMAFYVNLCFSIPNFSSQDFRYIAYLIVVEVIFLGIYFMDSPMRKQFVFVKRFLMAVSVCFMVSATAVYLLLGLIQN